MSIGFLGFGQQENSNRSSVRLMRATQMTTTESVLSDKERRIYPRDLYKTIVGMAQNGGKKPTGLTGAISDFLSEKNPQLGNTANGMTLLVPLESLVSRKALIAGSAPSGGFLASKTEK